MRLLFSNLILALLPCALLAQTPEGARVYGSSQTIFRWFEVLDPNDHSSKVFQVPVYEYITLGADNAGVDGLSVHFRGFGRLHIIDPVEGQGDKFAGDVLLWTMAYASKDARFFTRAGRQFLFFGAGNATLLDGVSVAARPGLDFDISAYAGYVPRPSLHYDSDHFAFGGRIAYDPWDYGRIGLSFGGERDDGQWARANIGVDAAFRYLRWLDISGSMLFDFFEKHREIQEVRAVAAIIFDEDFRLSFDYGMYNPTGRLPKTSIFTVFTNTKYHMAGGEFGFFGEDRFQARAYGRYFRYEGYSSSGYEAGFRPTLRLGHELQHLIGAEIARLEGPWNAYLMARFFGRYRPLRQLDLAVDFAEYLYEKKVSGYDRSHIAIFTAGYEVFDRAWLRADCWVIVNPQFEQNWVGLLRLTYDFSSVGFDKKETPLAGWL